jgi:hypothetical protein
MSLFRPHTFTKFQVRDSDRGDYRGNGPLVWLLPSRAGYEWMTSRLLRTTNAQVVMRCCAIRTPRTPRLHTTAGGMHNAGQGRAKWQPANKVHCAKSFWLEFTVFFMLRVGSGRKVPKGGFSCSSMPHLTCSAPFISSFFEKAAHLFLTDCESIHA